MSQDTHNALVLELSKLLVGKQVDSDIVKKALACICQCFKFDCGCIYETDQQNYFNLKESFCTSEMSLNNTFSINDINPEYRSAISKEILVYVCGGEHSTPHEEELLSIFSAQSLALVTIVDENFRINGFVVFSHKARQEMPSREDIDGLTSVMYLLSRYVSIRVYASRLIFAQTSLESILDNTGIDIYVNDFYTHEILYANKSMAAPYGGISRFLNNKCWEVLFPGQKGTCVFCPQTKLIDEEGNPTKIYSWDYQRPFDGSWFRVFSAAFRWVDGRLAHVVSSADITDNKRNEELIEYMANYDQLTRLPNRRKLVAECERLITRAGPGEKAYVLFFDIDGFKKVNDTLGHSAGDELLVKLGEFFSGLPMLHEAIYRNGGDEFVAVLGGNVKRMNIVSLVGFIHERFKQPWQLSKGEIYCNTSVGVACYPDDGTVAEDLLGKADQAMYKVKMDGGGSICFADELK